MRKLLISLCLVLCIATTSWAGAIFDGGGIIASEVDGSPLAYVYKVILPNGTLSITSGVATYTAAGGVGDVLADGTVPMTGALTPTVAGGETMGTALLPFSSLYIGAAATNNIQLTGTAASAKVVTLPGQTGTVVVGPTTTTANQHFAGTATAGLGAWSTATYTDTYVQGGLLHNATANTVAALAPGAIGSFLMSNGASAALSYLAAGAANYQLVGVGVTTIPVWTASTGTGSPVLGTSPAITTDIHAATAGGATVGTALLPFSSVYIGGAATNNIQLTGTSAAARSHTIPDIAANSTLLVTDSTTTTAGKIPLSTTTAGKHTYSTPTYPAASGTARKMLVSDGTNNVYSTELWPIATTAGNVMVADGTDWVTTAPLIITHSTSTPITVTCPTSTGNKKIYTNSGNGADITFNLPECLSGSEGCQLIFIVTDVTYEMRVNPHDNDLFYGMYSTNAVSDRLEGDQVVGSILNLLCLKDDAAAYNWMTSGSGVWSDIN